MPDRKPATGPLVGLRILDLTRLLPGPLGTMLMADMGAEVIKVENPSSPDYVRSFPPYLNGESANYLSFNRSKKSVLLDYTTPEGRETFLQLVQTADVVVEQFRPGFLDRLGIGYEAAKAAKTDIIYVSVTGYGQTGPYAHLAGHDLNYMGIAGVLGLTGEAGGPPVIPGVQMADIAGGSYMTVVATLAAVYARQQTGQGQHVDVSMTDAVMPLLSVSYALFSGMRQAIPRGMLPLSGGLANYNVYPCQDGNYLAVGTLEPKFWQRFCEVIDRPDWLPLMLPGEPDRILQARQTVEELFLTEPLAHWVALGLQHDLPLTPVYDLPDLENDPHLQARQMIITQEHPKAGPFKSIGVPLKFSVTPARPAWPAPLLGEDTEAVLREIK
mgnify:CR=1 FL=1